MNKFVLISTFLLLPVCAWGETLNIKVRSRYLNIPISHRMERKRLTLTSKGEDSLSVVVRIADNAPDYWVFKDVSRYKGKNLELNYEGSMSALEKIVQSDSIFGESMMYKEANRPQFHFTARRGWINDPMGYITCITSTTLMNVIGKI